MAPPTIFNTIAVHVANQSYNATMNYGNARRITLHQGGYWQRLCYGSCFFCWHCSSFQTAQC